MSKLKDINLGDLGIKSKNDISLQEVRGFTLNPRSEMEFNDAFYKSKSKKRMHNESYYERINNPSTINNNKFLEYDNIIENIKDKPGQYLDKRAE